MSTNSQQVGKLFARLKASLSPGGYFALQMAVGVVVFTVGAWLFRGIAEDVMTGQPLVALDLRAERWFHSHQTPWLDRTLSRVSQVHEWRGISGATLLLLLYLLWRRNWRWLTTVICAVPGGMLLDTILKLAFHRARPTLSDLTAVLHTYSFPSGHVMAATLFYGVAAAYLATRLYSWRLEFLAPLVACCLVAIVAFSRIYLGVHFLSDVLAAVAAGVAWLAFCLMAVDTLWYRLGRHHNGGTRT
jgi:membrane-associated phospholipid phosphatase